MGEKRIGRPHDAILRDPFDETARQFVYQHKTDFFLIAVNESMAHRVKGLEAGGLPMNQRSGFKVYGVALLVLSTAAGCAAFNPQGAAQQYAPNYYNAPYSSLSAQQKMQLEDHLANQSNQAWRTSASVVSSVGHLAGGTGILLFAVRH